MADIQTRVTTSAASGGGLPQPAAVLAYAGALPLIICALLAVVRPADLGLEAVRFMTIYGAVLIAFFGGVRWGVAIMRPEGPSFAGLLGGAVPMLIALPIFYLSSDLAKLLLLLLALPLLLLDDLRATRRGSGAPDWYLGVRTPLTILMTASFAFAAVQQILN